MDKHQALYAFWSSFDLPAYDENTVPPDAALPYITYEDATGSMDDVISLSASLWYQDTSWAAVSQKAQEISDHIETMDPMTLRLDTGRLHIFRGQPWDRRMNEPEDDGIRRIVLNYQAEFLTQS